MKFTYRYTVNIAEVFWLTFFIPWIWIRLQMEINSVLILIRIVCGSEALVKVRGGREWCNTVPHLLLSGKLGLRHPLVEAVEDVVAHTPHPVFTS